MDNIDRANEARATWHWRRTLGFGVLFALLFVDSVGYWLYDQQERKNDWMSWGAGRFHGLIDEARVNGRQHYRATTALAKAAEPGDVSEDGELDFSKSAIGWWQATVVISRHTDYDYWLLWSFERPFHSTYEGQIHFSHDFPPPEP